jgi:hypothetical protein
MLTLVPESRRPEAHGAIQCLRALRAGWRLPATQALGNVAGHAPISLLLFGQRASYDYLLEKWFGSNWTARPEKEWTFSEAARLHLRQTDAQVVLAPATPWTARLFSRKGWTILPFWVDCCLSLEPSVETVLGAISRTLRQEMRATEALGYTLEYSDGKDDLEVFWTQMHLPTIRGRHGVHGILAELSQGQELLQNGRFMKLYRGKEWVAGGLMVHRAQELWFAKLGWLQGDQDLLRAHVVNLLYRGAIRYAAESGYRRINLGGCRGFLDDGIFQYKMKWRAVPEIRRFQYSGSVLWGPLYDLYAVRFDSANETVQHLLAKHPILAARGNHLEFLTWKRERPRLIEHLHSLGWQDLSIG